MHSPHHRRLARRHRGLAPLALAGVLLSGCALASGPATDLVALLPPDRGIATRDAASPSASVGGSLGPYSLDLFRPGDHVAQFDDSWCVGASMQMMINIIEPGPPDQTRDTQRRLYRLARRTSPWVETRPGASVYGWAEGLEDLGNGAYEERAAGTRQAALRLAARQMRATNRPVGLLVWAGAHAWVMSGFKATADPALTDDFRVTHIWIEDPWTGRVSRTWGAGLEPHTLLTAAALGGDFVRYASVYRPEYGRAGKFVVVAPVEEPSAPT